MSFWTDPAQKAPCQAEPGRKRAGTSPKTQRSDNNNLTCEFQTGKSGDCGIVEIRRCFHSYSCRQKPTPNFLGEIIEIIEIVNLFP